MLHSALLSDKSKCLLLFTKISIGAAVAFLWVSFPVKGVTTLLSFGLGYFGVGCKGHVSRKLYAEPFTVASNIVRSNCEHLNPAGVCVPQKEKLL